MKTNKTAGLYGEIVYPSFGAPAASAAERVRPAPTKADESMPRRLWAEPRGARVRG